MSETFYSPNGRVWVALFLVALGFLLASLLPTINLPWVEEDDYYAALYSQAAHNNLRAGLCVTGGVPVTLYFGPLPIPRDAYYVHHPVLMPLMVTAAVAIFGEREWSVRLVPILCSVASALFLWLLVRDAMGRRAAALAAAFFVTLPMELHYGDMVDFEPPILTLMLAALVCLRYWHVRGTNVWIALAGFCCGGAMWTDWPGYLFVLSISIWLLLRKERSARFFGIALLAIAAASGTLFLLQIRHLNPGSWRDLWTAVTIRLGNGVAAGSSQIDPAAELHFTFGKWVRRILQSLGQDYLSWTWGFVLLGTIFLVRNRKSSDWRWLGWAVLQMGGGGDSLHAAAAQLVVYSRLGEFLFDRGHFYSERPWIGRSDGMDGSQYGKILSACRRDRYSHPVRLPEREGTHAGGGATLPTHHVGWTSV
jgi:4-amino-4-deoxy-L-arabinose transferase-like glycosyltransferase